MFKHRIRIIKCLLPLAMMFNGCGGGTTGTGIDASLLCGTVINDDGAPVIDATLTALQTGEETNTDSDGHFCFQNLQDPSEIELQIQSSTVNTVSKVPGLISSSNDGPVDVLLVVNESAGTVQAIPAPEMQEVN